MAAAFSKQDIYINVKIYNKKKKLKKQPISINANKSQITDYD